MSDRHLIEHSLHPRIAADVFLHRFVLARVTFAPHQYLLSNIFNAAYQVHDLLHVIDNIGKIR